MVEIGDIMSTVWGGIFHIAGALGKHFYKGGFVWERIRPIKSTSQIPSRARWITVSRNLKEEAKDEPVSGVGYEIIDLLTQKQSRCSELGRVGVLLLYYYIGPCGQYFEAQIDMRFFGT